MIRIGLCDDEINVLENLSSVISLVLAKIDFEAEVKIVTASQDTIYEAIKNKDLDILFLDVDFGANGKNGIKFAKELRELNKDFRLVFLTGHFEYSLLAFKCKTFDYILKPISRQQFNFCT